jgi:PAS domain S-box-containing protein
LHALLHQAREPVFLLDHRRRLVYVNPAWVALTGYTAETVSGLECRPHGPERDGDLASLGASFAPPPETLAGRPAGGPTLIVSQAGERLWRRIEFWPYHNPRGTLIGLFGLIRDTDAPAHTADAESQRLRAELALLRERLRVERGSDALLGLGPAHRRLLDQVAAAAATSVPVLVVGEPGTGKRTVARAIHQQSDRRSAPLVPFDCVALPPELFERELFGAGSAPGLAPGSTALLVDVLELPRDLQERLAAAAVTGPVRLIATAAADPDVARDQDRLRPDLYFALTTLVIHLRPLRERLDELPLLAQHLLERQNIRGARRRLGFSAPALAVLAEYDWPGNLRELARVVEFAHEHADTDLIGAQDLPAAISGHLGAAYTPPAVPPPITPLDHVLTHLERRLIEEALARARQNKSRAAELLGISRPRLYRRIKELNLPDVPEPAEEAPVRP